MPILSPARKVSWPFRVAAWVLLLGDAAMLVDLLVRLLYSSVELQRSGTIYTILVGVFGLITFGYVGLTGHSPPPLRQLEGAWNGAFGTEQSSWLASRSKLFYLIVIPLGCLTLVVMADVRGFFDDDIRGLVLLIYVMAAVGSLALVWRYFKQPPPNKSLERTRDG